MIRKALSSVVVAGVLGALFAPVASAWPVPVTPDMQRFIDSARANGAVGSDDELLMQGTLACRILYTRQGTAAAEAQTSPAVVRAARGTICTQAPG